MSDMEKDNGRLLGYGQEVEIFIGKDPETGKTLTRKFHITPASLKDIPALFSRVSKFENVSATGEFSDQDIDNAAEIIHMAVKRMHPDVKKEDILSMFTLSSLGRTVRIVMDVNEFSKEMGEMNQGREVVASA